MQSIHLSGLFVQPIIQRVREWNAEGKITEDDLERALSTDARAHVDHSIGRSDWASLGDVECLVALAAEQIGGETGFVEWAEEVVESWGEEESIERLMRAGRSLPDAPGFIVSQVSEILVRDADWLYDGGRLAFSVRLRGMSHASPALKSFLGALLAGIAVASKDRDFDVRFEGVDHDDLVIFGEHPVHDDVGRESRLHRAALIA
jgi:hypothetical protein